MTILILANHVNYGGITAYVFNLCRALHDQGNLQIYVGSRGGDLERDFINLGISHIKLPLTTKCEINPKVFMSCLQLLKFFRRHPVDVIHANTRVTQVLAALLSRGSGIPYISTCHGYFKTRLFRRVWPCWGQKVIAISDAVREHLIRDFGVEPSRVVVIYNGVDLEKFHPFAKEEIDARKRLLGLAPDKKIVGHIGRLSCVKGQKFLIMAAAEIVQKRKDVQFLIIGSGEENENLERLIREKSLDSFVFLRPSVGDTAFSLAAMDVFVMPSLQEGLGLSILEAQAQGVPVVATCVGGIPTIIKDRRTGLLIPAQDARALAAGICELLDNQALKTFVVTEAKRQMGEKFSLALMAEKTQNIYQSVGRLRC